MKRISDEEESNIVWPNIVALIISLCAIMLSILNLLHVHVLWWL